MESSITSGTKRQRIHRAIFLFGLGLFAVSYIFLMHVNIYAVLILFLNWISEGGFKAKLNVIKQQRMLWLFLSLYLVHVIGIFYSSNLTGGFLHLERKLGLLVLPLVLGTTRPLKKEQFHLLLMLFVSSIFAALVLCYAYAVYSHFWLHIPDPLSVDRFHSILGVHRTFFGLSIAFSATILMWFIREKVIATIRQRFMIGSLILFFLVSLVLLASRMPLLSMVVIIVFMTFISLSRVIRRKSALTAILFVAIIGAGFVQVSDNSSVDRLSNYKETSRQEMWMAAVELIPEAMPFGFGLGDVDAERARKYLENGLYTVYNLNHNFHNQYLETILQLGIPGILILLANLTIVFLIAIRKKKYLAAYFIVFVGLGFVTESMFQTQKGVMFYAFFNSLLCFNYLLIDNETNKPVAG